MTIIRRPLRIRRRFRKGEMTVKEQYEELDWEIIGFSAPDIITTSREYDEDLDGEYVEE